MSAKSVFVVLTTVTSLMAAVTMAQTTPGPPSAVCSSFPPFNANSTSGLKQPYMNLMAWHSVLLIIGIGLFGVVVACVFKFIRKRLYNDTCDVSDTFFDAGGDIHFALVACSVVARWLWTSSFTWSSLEVYNFGLVGHFWYSAATSVPILLFAIAAFQLRVKAPGAKTFLQVIERRFGRVPHVVMIAIALIVNLFIGGMIEMEAVRIISSVTQSVSTLAIAVLISIMTGIFSSQGGVGGGVYFNYFAAVIVISIALTYFIDTFYNPLKRAGALFAAPVASTVYKASSCAGSPSSMSSNGAGSVLTFGSSGALADAVTVLLSSFGCVFVDQSFWQAAVTAAPADAVGGFISGGLTFFVVPFIFSFVFGMSFWTISIQQGSFAVDPATANSGLLPVIISQGLLTSTGDFLMVVITLAVTISALSSQLLSIVSILMHDVYLTYVEKKVPVTSSTAIVTPMQPSDDPAAAQITKEESKEFARFRRSHAFLKIMFIVLTSLALFTSARIMLSLNVPLGFVFKLVGVISGSAVVPVLFSVSWHRTTSGGVLAGIFVGFAAGFTGWLAYAGAQPGPLYLNVGQSLPFLVGLALSVGLGGLVCLCVSLLFGGCHESISEQAMWEKTAKIDNPLSPWTAKYAASIDVSIVNKRTGLPDFGQFRKNFRNVELVTYIGSVLLSLILMVFWPALMLTAGTFNESTFTNWTTLVLALGIIATVYIGIVPLILEIIQQCRQAANEGDANHTCLEDDLSSTSATQQRTLQNVNLPQPPEYHLRFASVQHQQLQQQQQHCASPFPVLSDAGTLANCTSGQIPTSTNAGNNYIVRPLGITTNHAADSSQVWKTSVHLD